ncbi:hypothetical protein K5I29_04140 [Flavobacterium agricola]|uniref:Uncharacterized protein n=1 Tax=Flavobacterium agricola TaxID=2870839 RepID=A0ABY6M0R8_9FLAO|nr:hypothetical protein [Flavobacterium agricola]UYW02099.1 hypothetical protein K5I29_04140 [Flavobacterium agricola]
MTKEDKIKEAWGCLMPEHGVKENGWTAEQILNKDLEKYRYGKFDLVYSKTGAFARPKSLQGIETNNGWVKIESEADLPKENGKYLTYRKNGIIIEEYFYLSHPYSWQKFYNVTHYQPIEKPKPPIY